MSIKNYFQESFQELHSVTWPTRKQAVRISVVVLLFMAATAVILGAMDQLLSMGYQALLSIQKL